ncbi:hypothetical protein QO010_002457 [Caulobacter ginsengisoli]|uniref:Uncharacterized protein n=1 Tax=Caulobacter ginsengisoli TaxID=400775 RepID=A0ABU0IRN5_9CAUL|nr:hypothetical protein [Caulobacter ginsengisoli]MDQ0464673.1 hypothetical protein [Caulobacter ginsengisoli]
MRHDHTGDPTVAVKILLAAAAALAIAVGLLMPLPGQSKPDATHSQIPTMEVGKG